MSEAGDERLDVEVRGGTQECQSRQVVATQTRLAPLVADL